MKILARIHQVLRGHSARALVRAVDAEGFEYKLEVPAEAAEELSPEHVLAIAWEAHRIPPAPDTTEAPAATPAESVDLVPTASAEPASGPSPGARQLASLLGLKL